MTYGSTWAVMGKIFEKDVFNTYRKVEWVCSLTKFNHKAQLKLVSHVTTLLYFLYLSVPDLMKHTQTHFLSLPHLNQLLKGLIKENQGLSQSLGNEPAFSLMAFTEKIRGNCERTERLADYSSARIHASAACLRHDGIWQSSLCFCRSNRDE